MKRKIPQYTDYQKEWIIEQSKDHTKTIAEITEEFNKKFNQNRAEHSINYLRRSLGAHKQLFYTKEQIQFLREKAKIKGISNKELTDLFNREFNQQRTPIAIKKIRMKHKIILNQKMARKMVNNKNSKRKPIGTETEQRGYIYLKIGQPNKWVLKHRYIWEKHNRPLKDDEMVIFLDNNNKNFDINNLQVVKREHIARMNYNGYITENKELTQAGLNVVKINQKINELQSGKEGV